MNQAMREGFILTAAFADLLPAYEKQPDAMRLYYPDLIAAVDVKKEDKRLRTVEFAQSSAVASNCASGQNADRPGGRVPADRGRVDGANETSNRLANCIKTYSSRPMIRRKKAELCTVWP